MDDDGPVDSMDGKPTTLTTSPLDNSARPERRVCGLSWELPTAPTAYATA